MTLPGDLASIRDERRSKSSMVLVPSSTTRIEARSPFVSRVISILGFRKYLGARSSSRSSICASDFASKGLGKLGVLLLRHAFCIVLSWCPSMVIDWTNLRWASSPEGRRPSWLTKIISWVRRLAAVWWRLHRLHYYFCRRHELDGRSLLHHLRGSNLHQMWTPFPPFEQFTTT